MNLFCVLLIVFGCVSYSCRSKSTMSFGAYSSFLVSNVSSSGWCCLFDFLLLFVVVFFLFLLLFFVLVFVCVVKIGVMCCWKFIFIFSLLTFWFKWIVSVGIWYIVWFICINWCKIFFVCDDFIIICFVIFKLWLNYVCYSSSSYGCTRTRILLFFFTRVFGFSFGYGEFVCVLMIMNLFFGLYLFFIVNVIIVDVFCV